MTSLHSRQPGTKTRPALLTTVAFLRGHLSHVHAKRDESRRRAGVIKGRRRDERAAGRGRDSGGERAFLQADKSTTHARHPMFPRLPAAGGQSQARQKVVPGRCPGTDPELRPAVLKRDID